MDWSIVWFGLYFGMLRDWELDEGFCVLYVDDVLLDILVDVENEIWKSFQNFERSFVRMLQWFFQSIHTQENVAACVEVFVNKVSCFVVVCCRCWSDFPHDFPEFFDENLRIRWHVCTDKQFSRNSSCCLKNQFFRWNANIFFVACTES